MGRFGTHGIDTGDGRPQHPRNEDRRPENSEGPPPPPTHRGTSGGGGARSIAGRSLRSFLAVFLIGLTLEVLLLGFLAVSSPLGAMYPAVAAMFVLPGYLLVGSVALAWSDLTRQRLGRTADRGTADRGPVVLGLLLLVGYLIGLAFDAGDPAGRRFFALFLPYTLVPQLIGVLLLGFGRSSLGHRLLPRRGRPGSAQR